MASLPHVVIHNAVSADGRMDWISPDLGLYYRLAREFNEDATLIGADTVLAAEAMYPEDQASSDAEGSAETGEESRPILVLVDSRGRLQNLPRWRRQPYWGRLVVLCATSTPAEYIDRLRAMEIDCIVAGHERVDLRAALSELAESHRVRCVRVDSGGSLNGALLRAGLVNEISLLTCPQFVGGTSPRSVFRAPDLAGADCVVPLKLTHVDRLEGDVVWLRYDVVPATT